MPLFSWEKKINTLFIRISCEHKFAWHHSQLYSVIFTLVSGIQHAKLDIQHKQHEGRVHLASEAAFESQLDQELPPMVSATIIQSDWRNNLARDSRNGRLEEILGTEDSGCYNFHFLLRCFSPYVVNTLSNSNSVLFPLQIWSANWHS